MEKKHVLYKFTYSPTMLNKKMLLLFLLRQSAISVSSNTNRLDFKQSFNPTLVYYFIVVLGDRLTFHNGMKFSTFDQDNDEYKNNCAASHTGSLWYKACFKCDLSRTDHKPVWSDAISKSIMMIKKI